MGCGMSSGVEKAAVREEARSLSSANSAGRSSSRGARAKQHIHVQTLLKLWPDFFQKSCKMSADHVCSSFLPFLTNLLPQHSRIISTRALSNPDLHAHFLHGRDLRPPPAALPGR